MKVMLDTNVILDVWLAREPFWRDSASLLARIERKELTGVICPTTVTTLHYLAQKVLGERRARGLVRQLLDLCTIGRVSGKTLETALDSRVKDFEDAVIEAVAITSRADVIATRDLRDFRHSRIPASEPDKVG